MYRDLYHGTTGDNILNIMREQAIKPNAEGKVFFSEWRYESVLMHGADRVRQATYAIKVRVVIPATAIVQRGATPGVADTLAVATGVPIAAEVLELYIRMPGAAEVEVVRGRPEIESALRR